MLIRQIYSELEREQAMRQFVFPRLMAQGKLQESEHIQRLDRLEAALCVLSTLMDHGIATVEELPLRLTPGPDLKTGTQSTSNLPIIKGGE